MWKAPLQTGWHHCAHVPRHSPLPPRRPTACSGLSTWLMLPRAVLKASCALLTPQDSSSAAALLAPRLCTGTSVVQMQLTGVGKGSSCLGKEAVPHEALASHSSGKAEIQNPASPPPMAQVLLRCGCGSCDPHIRQHRGLGTKECVLHYSNPDPAEPHRIPSAALCQGPSDINTDIQHGICLEDLCPGLRQAGICHASCEVDASQDCTSELRLRPTCLGLHFLPSFL